MKVEHYGNGSLERTILTGLITDTAALGRIAAKWDGDLFQSKWSNLIAKWCCSYFNKYQKAPGKQIESLFNEWASSSREKETIQLVERFLSGLSGEYESLTEETNSDYLVDLASKHFNEVKVRQLRDDLDNDLRSGQLAKALEKINQYHPVEIAASDGIDILRDQLAIKEAFADKQESLVTYPGDLGKFFGAALARDSFISFCGPIKRGKSWVLQDVAWRAMCQRHKVAFFEVGDMTQDQILRRFMIRAAKHPRKPRMVRHPIAIKYVEGAKHAQVEFEEQVFDTPLDWRTAWRACQRTIEHKIRSDETMLRLSCHPAGTLNVRGIKGQLLTWERQGWRPDVIVIDYADILAPEDTRKEGVDQISETWMRLRGLSQEQHCLLVTATQTNAASFGAETIGRRHFSGSKLKLAHVTGMIGLSQNEDEKAQEVIRLNWNALRDEEYTEGRCVHIAQCLALAQFAVLSTF